MFDFNKLGDKNESINAMNISTISPLHNILVCKKFIQFKANSLLQIFNHQFNNKNVYN